MATLKLFLGNTEPVTGGITGTLTQTLGALVLAATGTVTTPSYPEIYGSLANCVLEGVTSTGIGAVAVRAELAYTLKSASVSGAGTVVSNFRIATLDKQLDNVTSYSEGHAAQPPTGIRMDQFLGLRGQLKFWR